ncbi:hypothetical protein [Flavobacterium sp. 3HN19-14]|uniref:hypothetical protein n=1 Tax=Flavobacterium sp. 3HN19-14 TaxID=3448133 RepID=UPI003EE1FE3F
MAKQELTQKEKRIKYLTDGIREYRNEFPDSIIQNWQRQLNCLLNRCQPHTITYFMS